MHRHLPADRFAVERGRAFIEHIERHTRRSAGGAAILVFFEQPHDLGAPLFGPGLRVPHGLTVREHQWIRKCVGPDQRFVVIDRNARNHRGGRFFRLRIRGETA